MYSLLLINNNASSIQNNSKYLMCIFNKSLESSWLEDIKIKIDECTTFLIINMIVFIYWKRFACQVLEIKHSKFSHILDKDEVKSRVTIYFRKAPC